MVTETPWVKQQRELTIEMAKRFAEEQGTTRELYALLATIDSEGNQGGGTVEGLPYRLSRNGMCNWCGYVGVFHDHPAYGKGYGEIDISVHGGLTFAGDVPEWGHGEMWWLGFDTSHASDSGLLSLWEGTDGWPSYKDKQFVTNECQKLAKQLNTMAAKTLKANTDKINQC